MSSSSSASRAASRLVESGSSVAALLVGDEGGAQSDAADRLARAWHCLTPREGEACDECRACGAFSRGASADVMFLIPGGPQDLIRLGTVVDDPTNPEPNVRTFLQSPPALGRNRVVSIERADRLTPDAANALLKTIEEPNETGRFVLTTSASGRILPTIRSRCLLIPCEAAELPVDLAGIASGGSSLQFERLTSEELKPFLAALESFVKKVSKSRRTEAVALADDYLGLADQYVDVSEVGEERLRRAEFARLFANIAGSNAAESEQWRGLLDRSILVHRAILGNVNAGYLADWLFTSN